MGDIIVTEASMTKREIPLKPIGIIRTSYSALKDIPIQGRLRRDAKGRIELFPEYQRGLKDVEGFSHLILVYYFHKAREERLISKPFLENKPHGIFAIRSPLRPNHIGISIVRLRSIKKNSVTFSGVDMLNGTPLLDIKPYIPSIDARSDVKVGWLTKHLAPGGEFKGYGGKEKALREKRVKNCIFCRLAEKKPIAETSLAYAIKDKHPVTKGHVLIIPKRHVSSAFDLREDEMNSCVDLMRRQKNKIASQDPTVRGYNLGVNIDEAGGQTVFHCHWHLIPRRKGDVPHPRGGVRHIIPGKGDYKPEAFDYLSHSDKIR